jgi:hypothetical protein
MSQLRVNDADGNQWPRRYCTSRPFKIIRLGYVRRGLLIVVSLTTAPDLVQNVARPENTKEWLEITRLKSSGVLNRCHSFPSETNTPQT